MCTSLINLDGTVDLADEEIGRIEADGAGEHPERDHHQHRVAKVQQRWNELCDFQLKIKHIKI